MKFIFEVEEAKEKVIGKIIKFNLIFMLTFRDVLICWWNFMLFYWIETFLFASISSSAHLTWQQLFFILHTIFDIVGEEQRRDREKKNLFFSTTEIFSLKGKKMWCMQKNEREIMWKMIRTKRERKNRVFFFFFCLHCYVKFFLGEISLVGTVRKGWELEETKDE